MNIDIFKIIQGEKIEIVEMVLINKNEQLELSWKISLYDLSLKITFYNVSRFRMNNISTPIEIHGFEIINHSQNGWEKDSTYEIHDYEFDNVNFFCEYFKIVQENTEI